MEENSIEENVVNWKLFLNRKEKVIPVRTSSSCCFSCAFCTYPKHAGKYKPLSVEAIEKELDTLHDTGMVESINFIDDTFNVPISRFKEILKMIIRKKYKFKWHSYIRCQYLDKETVELMKESGAEAVFLGIESGSQSILDNMNKKVRVEDYERGHKLLNDNEILTYDYFIVGFPGETEETVNETMQFIQRVKPTFYRAACWFCDTKAPVWEMRDKFGIDGYGFDWKHNTMDVDLSQKLIQKMFFSIKDSVYFGSAYTSIIQMLHYGMSIVDVRNLASAYNQAVSERILNPQIKTFSDEILEKIKQECLIHSGKVCSG